MSLQAAFNAQDWSVLSGPLRLKPMAQCDRQRSLSARALLDDETCIALLDQLGPVIGSPTRAITASLLAKRFPFSPPAPACTPCRCATRACCCPWTIA